MSGRKPWHWGNVIMSWAAVDACVFTEAAFCWYRFLACWFLHDFLTQVFYIQDCGACSVALLKRRCQKTTTPVSSHILCFFSPLCCPFLLNKSSPPIQIFFHCVACFSCTLHSLHHMRSGLSIFIMGVWPSYWCSLWVMGMCFSLLPCQNKS